MFGLRRTWKEPRRERDNGGSQLNIPDLFKKRGSLERLRSREEKQKRQSAVNIQALYGKETTTTNNVLIAGLCRNSIKQGPDMKPLNNVAVGT